MYVSLATGLLAALLAPTALAGAGPGKPPPLELRPVDYAMQGRDLCYPSGLHVAVVWDDRLPVVSLTMVLDRGSASDPAEAAGAAHLLEHLWFRARPGGGAEVRDRLHALGALNNAFTGPDTTTYTTLGSAERLEDLLALEAARLAAPLEGVGPEELAGEQRIVASEHRRAIGLMGSEALRLLPGDFFPEGHPYRDMPLETVGSVAAITLEQLQALAADAHQPAHTTLLIRGAVGAERTQQAIEATFPEALLWREREGDGLPLETCGPRPSRPALKPRAEAPRELTVVEGPTAQPILMFGWPLPAAFGPDEQKMRMAVATLEFWVERGLAATPAERDLLGASCGFFPGQQGSWALCSMWVPPGANPARLERRALSELGGMTTVGEGEARKAYDRSIARVRAATVRSAEALSGIFAPEALEFAADLHFTGRSDYFQRNVAALDALDGAQVAAFIKQWIVRKQAVGVVVAPPGWVAPAEEAEEEAPEVTQAAKGDGGPSGQAAPAGGEGPREGWTPWEVPEGQEVDIAAMYVPPDLSKARSFRLDNGMRVVIVPFGDAPTVRAKLMFAGGEVQEPAPGAAAASHELVWYDTRPLDITLQDAVASIGGTWLRWQTLDATLFDLSASSGNLDGLLYLTRMLGAGAVTEMTQTWWDSQRLSSLRLLSRRAHVPGFWSQRARMEPLLGAHPLGLEYGHQRAIGLSQTKIATAKDWVQGLRQPEHATLILVGRLDPAEAETAARAAFDTWKQAGKPYPVGDTATIPAQLPARRVTVVPNPLRSGAQVAVSCRAARGDLPGSPARSVARELLAQQAWRDLRDSDFGAYAPWAGVDGTADGVAVLSMGVDSPPERAGEAVQRTLAALGGVARGEYDERALTAAKAEVATSFVAHHLTTQGLSWLVADAERYWGGFDSLSTLGVRFAAVSAKDVGDVLADCPNHETVSVEGPLEAIRASLDSARIAYDVIDIDEAAHDLRQGI
ncbi:MAG: insulinase family protein [Pseudomonadota bacterium]